MKPAPVDLPIIWRGCDWAPVVFRWKDADGLPADLTLWMPFVETSEFNLNPVITDPVHGVTQISLTGAETAMLKLGVYPWDWIWQTGTASLEVVTTGRPSNPNEAVLGDDGLVVTVGPGFPQVPIVRLPPLLAGKVQVKEPTTTP